MVVVSLRSQSENLEEAAEEFGWKLIHGDVFRAPPAPMFFSVVIGNGTQVLAMVLTTLFFACLGFLSPGSIVLGGAQMFD